MIEKRTSVSRLLRAGVGLAALGAGAWPGATLAQPAEDERPNVLIVYADDVSVHSRHLWCDEDLTPRLARFCREGVEFRHSIGSTPLCGPARAQLLTGRYGHNNGITDNPDDLDAFDPSSTVATAMQGAGYHTLFAGKYVNGIRVPRKKEVREFAEGWDEFDIIWRREGQKYKHFYDYRLWTRDGVTRRGSKPADHSTRVATERLAAHIREAPEDQPILAVASLYSGHAPNIAMARHIGSPVCRDVEPWSGGSYDEADVSDKPGYVAAQPRLGEPGFDLRKRCEELLTIDWATGKLMAALRDAGRLDDTLIIFTSDNGYIMGDHRRPKGKYWPYAVPVHLQTLWPAALGDERREVAEPVSNVDLAPTLCDIAGCELPEADGKSILPLITGETDTLDRSFVYAEYLHPEEEMPPWYQIRTTGSYADEASWVYTELGTGERELYELTTDPDELENLANLPEHSDRVAELHELLHSEVIEPGGVSFGAD